MDPQFWREALPELTLSEGAFAKPTTPFNIPNAIETTFKQQFLDEGYVQFLPKDWVLPIGTMAQAVIKLDGMGLPPVFGFMYDEFWQVWQKLNMFLGQQLGAEYKMLPDFWAWLVNPKKGESGWRPHRDKPQGSIAADGSPLSLTVWIPLTKATPLNGCMYIVPSNRDPGYASHSNDFSQVPLPNIRALPGEPGTIFCWNQQVLHWGGRSSTRAPEPRVSIACEFQRGDVKQMRDIWLEPLQVLDFSSRLKLICRQMLQYQHMYPLSAEHRILAENVLGPTRTQQY